jgi:hypothetical protein
LIWAFSSERGPCVAASARFKDMRLKLSTPRNKTGIAVDIYARMEGTRDKAGGRFVLDDSPAARQFCAEVERATDRLAEPLTRRPRRKWFRR